ncbi:hypothetical protein BC833DRAFT_578525 [Globomyces pollinis-pini]|nr:hypothetical protein BC833DRAFT_578525 [Globomyces pollinis-pini]
MGKVKSKRSNKRELDVDKTLIESDSEELWQLINKLKKEKSKPPKTDDSKSQLTKWSKVFTQSIEKHKHYLDGMIPEASLFDSFNVQDELPLITKIKANHQQCLKTSYENQKLLESVTRLWNSWLADIAQLGILIVKLTLELEQESQYTQKKTEFDARLNECLQNESEKLNTAFNPEYFSAFIKMCQN